MINFNLFCNIIQRIITTVLIGLLILSCQNKKKELEKQSITAEQILGNPEYLAMSYGGYRHGTRDEQPSISDIQEDLLLMSASGIKIIRTYNLQLPQAENILKAVRKIKETQPKFEMYVMLGAWIDCKNAWSDQPVDHGAENLVNNSSEILKAIKLANQYPDIIKIISVGNEAMVHWATSYFVEPKIILKWVKYLQQAKENNELPKDIWITSSDNFASWGGGGSEYHNVHLDSLIKAVDYLSVHTYPFHDTHYNPEFWESPIEEKELSDSQKVENAMDRAVQYAIDQFNAVQYYLKKLGVEKPLHIGETGWASVSQGLYGDSGSRAADEYKQALYYKKMRKWTNKNKISCFYFEAFDEKWKDPNHKNGSENHFGLFTIDGKAKMALWEEVDNGIFNGLGRNGSEVTKTFDGHEKLVRKTVFPPKNKDQK